MVKAQKTEQHTATAQDRLPGDLTKEAQVARMIRVDQAGEFGAKRIYEGQLSVLKGRSCESVIQHMKDQELEHLAYFDKQMVTRQVRPTVLSPFWNVAGFALGAATAMMGEKAAMACTVAVEEVIDEHYQEQLAQLGDDEKELKENIEKFRQEELEHRDTGLAHDAEQTPGYALLSSAIKTGSKAAIWLATRF